MKIAFFDAQDYHVKYFEELKGNHKITYFKDELTAKTASKAKGFDAVCCFVNAWASREVLTALKEVGVKIWLQRTMGYNKVDLKAAAELGIHVYRVPNYSAETVGEHAMSLLMAANRHIPEAISRTQKYNFLIEGLSGKCLHSSTIGVVGAGKIGQTFIKIAVGTGARVIVSDAFAEEHFPDTAKKLGFKYVDLNTLLTESDFISLHAPSLPSTFHMLNEKTFAKMKDDAIVINAARGDLIDTSALVKTLKSGKLRGVALDVIEREEGLFFFDRSADKAKLQAKDPEWKYLLSHPRVIVTAHLAFFSELSLEQIAKKTIENATDAENGNYEPCLVIQENGRVKNG